MYLNKKIAIFVAVVGMIAFAGLCRADGIKDRMRKRLPVINDLKARGILGENNQGYLAFPTGKKESQQVVDAENSDRRIVYESIAQKTGTTPEIVGQRRAIQIFENAGPGEWFQDKAGKWFRK